MLRQGCTSTLQIAVLLLGALPLVAAHGDDHGDHDAPMSAPTKTTAHMNATEPRSYFAYSEHVGTVYTHIALMVVAWVFALPVAVMLSVAKSRYTLVAQFCFLLINGLGLLVGVVYNHQTPDLYEHSSHSPIGWIATWIASAWTIVGVIRRYARAVVGQYEPLAVSASTRYEQLQQQRFLSPDPPRWSNDSGQGTERNSESLYGHSRSGSLQDDMLPSRKYHEDADDQLLDGRPEKRGFFRNTRIDKFLAETVPRVFVGRTLSTLGFFHNIIDRTILLLGFVAFTTGLVVFGGIARGSGVFSVLAHFVKGGIFFWYGLLTLGRWMGAFTEFGWAWNVKPPREMVGRWKFAVPSAEFTESFVIFLYGISNVFLEHLAAWGDAWSPSDLEHVSITIMFFGGGLLGMLVESHRVRSLLNYTVQSNRNAGKASGDERWTQPKTYSFSMNPMPGLIILLLGVLMGSHHQASMVSTMIHKQWGTLFVGFAIARATTYLILFVSPPTSYFPSRPPTELVAAFCLAAGGIIFMESNKDTVAALEAYDLDAMFTLVVSIGLTAVIMAWVMVTFAIRGWAQRREDVRRSSSSRSTA